MRLFSFIVVLLIVGCSVAPVLAVGAKQGPQVQ